MGFEPTKPLQEKKQHGSILFPFTIYPCTIPLDFPSVALHWHKSMEIIYIKKGRGRAQVDLQTMDVESGDVLVLPPGMLHALYGIPGNVMEYENIIFDVEFLGSGAADVCAQQYLVPLVTGQLALPTRLRAGQAEYTSVSDCLAEVEFLCGERGPGYELGVKAVMLRLLFLLLRMQPERKSAESAGTARLKAVLQRVEEAYAQPLTVEAMAQGCGCSASHFMRWFKQLTGTTFTVYLNERRLAVAAERLRQSSDSILFIAGEVGFENLSNFNRQFKARYGVTPREYRRNGIKTL